MARASGENVGVAPTSCCLSQYCSLAGRARVQYTMVLFAELSHVSILLFASPRTYPTATSPSQSAPSLPPARRVMTPGKRPRLCTQGAVLTDDVDSSAWNAQALEGGQEAFSWTW